MYHPAAALRTPAIEEASFADVVLVPSALEDARVHRSAARADTSASAPHAADAPGPRPPNRPSRSSRSLRPSTS